jgi:hypothetical protein
LRILHCVNLLDQGLEAVTHIRVLECAGFHEQKFLLFCEILCHKFGDLALLWAAAATLAHVEFIADEHDDDVGLSVLLHFVNPLLDGLESGHLHYVVDDERADGLAVVGAGDGTEALLAGGIPNLSLDGAARAEGHGLGGELDADGRVLVFREGIAYVSGENVRLADPGVPHQNHYTRHARSNLGPQERTLTLEQKIVVVFVPGVHH